MLPSYNVYKYALKWKINYILLHSIYFHSILFHSKILFTYSVCWLWANRVCMLIFNCTNVLNACLLGSESCTKH